MCWSGHQAVSANNRHREEHAHGQTEQEVAQLLARTGRHKARLRGRARLRRRRRGQGSARRRRREARRGLVCGGELLAFVGGGREALVAEGEKLATADETTAQVLLARRLEQLDGVRRGRALHGETRHVTLADFARAHLVAKAESQLFTEQWLAAAEKCLSRAVAF